MSSQISGFITQRLLAEASQLKEQFCSSKNLVGTRFFVVDNLLPEEWAHSIYERMPTYETMRKMKSFRESKATSKKLAVFDSIVVDALLAFHTENVVSVIEDITSIPNQVPDPLLYAGGLSLMQQGDFLNPHIDNSHDSERKLYRTLNLLYYVTPDWRADYGGNLELWSNVDRKKYLTIESLFNRLIVMETTQTSWHAVSPVTIDGKSRGCISNYFFSEDPPEKRDDYFHITAFMPRNSNGFSQALYWVDNATRSVLRRIRRRGFSRKDLNN